ncbi:MAG TPA: tetratricopeptide repeat protein [Candidatus Acidoferrales bacterium]|jgi:tetratricopeptide (TPR) repeat protein|nr:tetratricopeptide repeat protein [Candidatus Acidoferrales bacterium]
MRPALGQLAIAILLLALPAGARQNEQKPPNPPAGPAPGESSSSKPTNQPPATTPDTGNYDPVSAEDDIEVGTFYMHKGDIDAAISRYKDAIRLRSNFAKPRLLLAEAYEKKNDKASALKYYKEYLEVFPKAPDAKKVQNKIAKISSQ